MKDFNSWASSEDENDNCVMAGDKQDMMMITVTESSKTNTSPITATPISMVAVDNTQGFTSQERTLSGQGKAKSCAMGRAWEVKANLDPGFPSFIKSMLPSHISGKCRVRFPSHFCNAHLPKENIMINLIDESQVKYPVQYLVRKMGLSGGWKGFTTAHKLVDGDALVFQLVRPTEFQVYIVRAYCIAETNAIIGLPILDTQQIQTEPRKRIKTIETIAERCSMALPIADLHQAGRKSRSGSEEVGSEVLEGFSFSGIRNEFNNIKSADSFSIAVNGVVIDSEFSELARRKYYELCCSRKAFLHENLLSTINWKLAAGFISQTINIADGIRSSKLSTTQDEFAAWDTNLGAFEQLGMDVGFLRARIKKLVSLVLESEKWIDTRRYREAITGRDDVKGQIKTLKAKLFDLEEASKRFDTEIKTFEVTAEHYELKFRAEVYAPW